MEERVDEIGFGELKLIQKPSAFCYGVDAVILSDFARVKNRGRVCDLGTGTGVIPLILSHKTQAAEIWGVEVQESSYDRAVRSVELNQLQHRIHLLHCDVKQAAGQLGKGTFDTVVSNPPYMGRVNGLKNQCGEKLIARHETSADLRDFMAAAQELLRERGDFYMVHRPSRLVDICQFGRELRLEPKEMRFVSPNKDSKPNILLVHFVKYGNPELRLLPPLYVYEKDGGYTQEIRQIYERG